jgi:hypothetical protein
MKQLNKIEVLSSITAFSKIDLEMPGASNTETHKDLSVDTVGESLSEDFLSPLEDWIRCSEKYS